ncbi:transposase [Streptomyces sp. NRRL S-1813]|uniref:transposase n=1 Tax=Streptomyces sp. NRRL S-1813 TaxID=1463888 RepID=UPI00099C2F64
MLWKFRSGSQWRETPPEFGDWQTVHNRFVSGARRCFPGPWWGRRRPSAGPAGPAGAPHVRTFLSPPAGSPCSVTNPCARFCST